MMNASIEVPSGRPEIAQRFNAGFDAIKMVRAPEGGKKERSVEPGKLVGRMWLGCFFRPERDWFLFRRGKPALKRWAIFFALKAADLLLAHVINIPSP